MKILVLSAILIFLVAGVFQVNQVWAVTTVTWDATDHSIFAGNVSPFLVPESVQFTVTDTNLAGNGIVDKINVLVNSTSDPAGITLTLTEQPGDAGIFTNTNLIFPNGTGQFGIGSTQTVGISKPSLNTDPNVIEHIISGPSSSEGMQVFSTTDVGGTFLNLTETGPNTGIFTSTLKFTGGPSINGSAISVNPGDTVTIQDLNNFDLENELVTPNPDPAFGALPAKYLDTVSASYNGVIASTRLDSSAAPGGGSGGLIVPTVVLDILAGIGGSPYVVSPPSFGGGYAHYPDGLTFTQGTTNTVIDTSKYNQELPKQVMIPGEKATMKFKTFESYNANGVIHMGLYLIPRGEDMITTNSIASIVYDKNSPTQINDPNHILSKASASLTSDGTYQYTSFSFVPLKSYDKMSFLIRAWNDHMYSTDIRVHDDLVTPPSPKVLPTGVIQYNNLSDLQAALEKDGFYKPTVLARIHNVNEVFDSSQGGQVTWLYDTINHSVRVVIADKNGTEVGSQQSLLQPLPQEKKGDYGFMTFTTKQLNRQDEKQEQDACKKEADKAMNLALKEGLVVPSRW